jgi:hypothetical protein
MLCREIIGVNCGTDMEHKMHCAKMKSFLMLKQVVPIFTAEF